MRNYGLDRSFDESYLLERRLMRFAAPRQVLYGRGTAQRLPEYLDEQERSKVFVLTDRNLAAAGVGRELISAFERAGTTEVFEREAGEPKASEIDAIGESARRFGPSTIVAIGGGATMDAAKCVRVLAEFGGSVPDYEGRDLVPRASSVLLAAVATTAGTGSETGIATIYTDDASGAKTVVASPHMLPDIAVVDPDLTVTVPPGTTAATGIDALCQAIGAYLTLGAHPITDVLALHSIRLLNGHVVGAVERGDDVATRGAMAYGSLLSGLAMNNAGAIADQFFDEVLGPRYGVPHGILSGVFMPYVLQFNRCFSSVKIASIGDEILPDPAGSEEERVDGVIARTAELVELLRLPGLRDIGVTEEDLDELADGVAAHSGVERGINPRPLTRDDALSILQSAWWRVDPLRSSS